MKFGIRTEIFAGILIAGASVNAIAGLNLNPYGVISVRNPFGLRAIPEKKVVEEPQTRLAPSVEIKLTGVASFPGSPPRAILEFIDTQSKKTDRPSPFREGDRYNEHIQIVGIDAALGLVRINNDGAELTLDFEKNGIKERSTPQSPGQPQNPVAYVPTPSGTNTRLISNRAPTNSLASPAPGTLSREELLARIAAQRARSQQQNSQIPPPSPNLTPY